ncbi:hypothetical protein QJ043_03335 [Olsenella sp. YH-ols2217]|uniref:Uncharacterized protein n=1 Tax=Kribbibacterium absianum TaxID=3044210 RepID=A0ABT6ZJP5_9ACTN|nr:MULTISPECIES: hypothetical protein [unclassified Olsenella]MDJ1122679.1 hypothetical protein [Olsenella sp. YH-ols2216]MDJ1129117.1 hypothetical protein [Olsenella sp. YH-ols2217]
MTELDKKKAEEQAVPADPVTVAEQNANMVAEEVEGALDDLEIDPNRAEDDQLEQDPAK